MITTQDYVGPHSNSPDWTRLRHNNAEQLLDAVNALLEHYYRETGNPLHINPATSSQVSGQTYGGFRPQSCPQGSPHSSHKEGLGVDVYDPADELDTWLNDDILEQFGLCREAPKFTKSWCHLTIRAPGSGKRTFIP